jgi:hypothetical protein
MPPRQKNSMKMLKQTLATRLIQLLEVFVLWGLVFGSIMVSPSTTLLSMRLWEKWNLGGFI